MNNDDPCQRANLLFCPLDVMEAPNSSLSFANPSSSNTADSVQAYPHISSEKTASFTKL